MAEDPAGGFICIFKYVVRRAVWEEGSSGEGRAQGFQRDPLDDTSPPASSSWSLETWEIPRYYQAFLMSTAVLCVLISIL